MLTLSGMTSADTKNKVKFNSQNLKGEKKTLMYKAHKKL